ncbi:hypothetical protein FNF29_04950 [Cafeteria roenbergensis]|uniref:Uncharacterized protein n=1 Tax=Cafeteria roenbergensis TaxID=33653 RepID=A0A5A8CCR7_CAFRO|nr:hypothetical protein FNF29_04950 [Cafeteria roenbergensis]|eukprot:KAA0150836.1 hypothetical protein FNF29_04950 [Cafeteria roenbergensis]
MPGASLVVLVWHILSVAYAAFRLWYAMLELPSFVRFGAHVLLSFELLSLSLACWVAGLYAFRPVFVPALYLSRLLLLGSLHRVPWMERSAIVSYLSFVVWTEVEAHALGLRSLASLVLVERYPWAWPNMGMRTMRDAAAGEAAGALPEGLGGVVASLGIVRDPGMGAADWVSATVAGLGATGLVAELFEAIRWGAVICAVGGLLVYAEMETRPAEPGAVAAKAGEGGLLGGASEGAVTPGRARDASEDAAAAHPSPAPAPAPAIVRGKTGAGGKRRAARSGRQRAPLRATNADVAASGAASLAGARGSRHSASPVAPGDDGQSPTTDRVALRRAALTEQRARVLLLAAMAGLVVTAFEAVAAAMARLDYPLPLALPESFRVRSLADLPLEFHALEARFQLRSIVSAHKDVEVLLASSWRHAGESGWVLDPPPHLMSADGRSALVTARDMAESAGVEPSWVAGRLAAIWKDVVLRPLAGLFGASSPGGEGPWSGAWPAAAGLPEGLGAAGDYGDIGELGGWADETPASGAAEGGRHADRAHRAAPTAAQIEEAETNLALMGGPLRPPLSVLPLASYYDWQQPHLHAATQAKFQAAVMQDGMRRRLNAKAVTNPDLRGWAGVDAEGEGAGERRP